MEMRTTVTSSFGDGKLSKEVELNDTMTIAPTGQDEFNKAMSQGGRH